MQNVGDPFYNSVSFLSHFDGTDGATTATEQTGKALTFTGNSQLDTAQKKFGVSSLLMDGTGDRVTTPNHSSLLLGSSDFTIELWVRFSSLVVTVQAFVSMYLNTGNQRAWSFRLDSNLLSFAYSTDGINPLSGVVAGSWTPVINTWYHIVAERNGSAWKTMADGVVIGTLTASATIFNSNQLVNISGINSAGFPAQELNGWVDDVRITKGVARYKGAYTVPSAPFPNYIAQPSVMVIN